MRVSVVIPTNRPAGNIRPCLEALARQELGANTLQVVVVCNGMDRPAARLIDDAPYELIIDAIEPANVGAARNRAQQHVRGELVLLMNDDVAARPDFVASHVAAQARLAAPGLVLGSSPWQRYAGETVFDRMIQTTSMVFFYDQLIPHHWYDFRHAWTLNLSMPRRIFDTFQFDEALQPVNFDDIEWAFRVELQAGLRVWYAPEAVAVHDHRYTPEAYFRREAQLGRMAGILAGCNPACFGAIFGSACDPEFRRYCRDYVKVEGRREAAQRAALESIWSRRIADGAMTDAALADLIRSLYLAHLPLKRVAFRRGLLEFLGEPECDCVAVANDGSSAEE